MIIIQTNCDSRKEAETIAKSLLKEKLAFVCHIGQVKSLYLWKGSLIEGKEFVLKIRTLKSKSVEVMSAIKELHSYEIPPIYTVVVEDASKEYMVLMQKELSQ